MSDSPNPAGPDPRSHILEAAGRVIARRGHYRARYADVAREAGVSVGSIQYYFDGRDALMNSTFHSFSQRTVSTAHEIFQQELSPTNRLLELLRYALGMDGGGNEEFQETWSVWLEYWSACNLDAELQSASSDVYDEWRRPFIEVIDDGISRREFAPSAPVRDIVDRLIGCIDGLAIRVVLEPDRMTRERALDLVTSQVEHDLNVALLNQRQSENSPQ